MFDAEADEDLPGGGYNVAPTDTIRIALEQVYKSGSTR
jgi:hypothetical protein